MAVVGGVADLITCAAIGAFGLGHVRPVVLVLVCWAQTDVVLLAALVGLVVLANLDRIVVIYRPRRPHRHKENHHRCHRQIRHFHQTYTHLAPHLNRPPHHNNATQFALGLASVVVVAVRA
jgi:hypothetical protein